MKKLNVATGSLVLVGMLLLMGGVVLKVSSLNLFEPLVTSQGGFFLIANTCFLLALVIDRFDGKE